MKINEIIDYLEQIAPPQFQEHYDNAGLITGQPDWECSGIMICLDVTERVISDALEKKCNMVIAHHPIIFKGLKKITGKNYVERTVIKAIKNDVAIYSIHTNLDNMISGVNGKMAELLNLTHLKILAPKENVLKKLFTFIPKNKVEEVRSAIFNTGAGQIGNYSECSFNMPGLGTFKAGKDADPYLGEVGKLHVEEEMKVEIIFPFYMQQKVISALIKAHPYEEVAYDIVNLSNDHQHIGSGIIGILPNPLPELEFLELLKKTFRISVIRHTELPGKLVHKVALCGGSGSFLIPQAIAREADIFITSDVKYHEFFDADNRIIIADIGHYESEQFTINLLHELLELKFPNFAVLKTEVNTNPLRYYVD
ncbi:MAG: Nif3-like dinuclear metal center hexameric protein [Chitinophagaceae bacterium]|jgi:dinuclear metal center YbgI/SA1388 family protein|nr:Nif3-like dinuclear metal center hexameric protein [Chitinophagaceae bacterium]